VTEVASSIFRRPSSSTSVGQATSPRRTNAPGSPSVAASSLDFFRFSRLRGLRPVAHSSFPLSIVFYVVGQNHIISENGRTRVPVRRRVVTRFFRFSCFRELTPVAHSSFPLSIVFYMVGPGHITSENGRTKVPVCGRVVTRFFRFSLASGD